MEFKQNELKKLISLLKDSDITKLEYKNADFQIKLELNKGQFTQVVQPQAVQEQTIQQPQIQVASASVASSEQENASNKNYQYIKSPMVGTFYSSQSPESPSYVSVGQKIKKGDVVCIIEAMKLMNEITSDFDGVVKEVYFDNASPVEFDTPLFAIEKN